MKVTDNKYQDHIFIKNKKLVINEKNMGILEKGKFGWITSKVLQEELYKALTFKTPV